MFVLVCGSLDLVRLLAPNFMGHKKYLRPCLGAEQGGRGLSCESPPPPSPSPEVDMAGEVEAPTPSLGCSRCLQACGASPGSVGWMQAPAAGLAGEGRACGWGEERRLLNSLPLGLANSLAWQKPLENEM